MQEAACRAVTFTSEGLTLEGLLHQPISASFPAAAVCHPHPLYGGDMNNNVVVAVSEALAAAGIAALRFNFRGVGRSEGTHAQGPGERADASAALTYLRQLARVDQDRVGIVGYSFGATVALMAADEQVATAAAISPPSLGQGLSDLAIRCPTLLITGDRDQFAPPASLATLASETTSECDVTVVPGADHFWWGHENELADLVAQFFRRHLVG